MMKLRLVRHLWGVDITHGLNHYLPRWRDAGYDLIETGGLTEPALGAVRRFLQETGWDFICQVFTNGSTPGGTVREHLDSLARQVEFHAADAPLFFNAHSGSDTWSLAESVDFYGGALELERREGVVIAHETHRLRCFGNPWTTRAVLGQVPGLKLTCDFSHWVCVAERLLGDCGDIIALAARHCHHLHARVGHEEGPQVSDPRAPEWGRHVAAHEAWWDQIWAVQQAAGAATSTLTPEFGPAPYMPLLPHTQAPVADLADICDWMARRQAARFAARHGG